MFSFLKQFLSQTFLVGNVQWQFERTVSLLSSTFSRNYITFQIELQVLVLSLISNSVSISVTFLGPK